MMRRAIIAFAERLATPSAFLCVMLTMVVFMAAGALLGWSQEWLLIFTLYLSMLAIVQASAILVAQHQGEKALHAKLDGLITAIDEADNRLIGIEHEVEGDGP